MQSKLTLIGMFSYDPTLFANLSMPTGIDTDIVRNEILTRSGEFEVLYSDPNFVKLMIDHWSKKHFRTFQKWIDALNIEYDPLNNYDRKEEYTDVRNAAHNSSSSGSDSYSDNHVDNESSSGSESGENGRTTNNVGNSSGHTTGSTSPAQTTNTKTTSVSAFDGGTLQTKEQTTDALTLQVAGSDSSDTSSSTASSEVESGNNSRTFSDNNQRAGALNHSGTKSDNISGNSNEVTKHNAHLFGNIGVTTSQQMLQSELDIARFNLYEQIADIFVEEFCLMVY